LTGGPGDGPAVVIHELLTGGADFRALRWQPLRPGVEIHRLWGEGPAGPGGALLRYAPGARVPCHEHRGFEQILVLSGWQADERRRYDSGTLFIHAPGTRHEVVSPEGCLVLAVWQGGTQIVGPG
jgi:anti-sigma factor ChrR (cupin superfamily)